MADREISPDYLRVLVADVRFTFSEFVAGSIPKMAAVTRMERHCSDITDLLPSNPAQVAQPSMRETLTKQAGEATVLAGKIAAMKQDDSDE